MATVEINVASLPANTQGSFRELGQLTAELMGEELLGFTAFGGWLADDPLYAGTPARSVLVLSRIDLRKLDQLAARGPRFGQRGLAAPLLMTPPYIAASRDVFPLELLEIQQTGIGVLGADHFGPLTFAPADVRLQCERELKSALIQLRQGLLAAAGQHKRLADVCRAEGDRLMRVLRGLLHLKGTAATGAGQLVAATAAQTGLPLETLKAAVANPAGVDFAAFERLYGELVALAEYVDKL